VQRRKLAGPLIYWCCERESIRKKRVAGAPYPWTEDPILRQYRFTNLRRRDDRVSQWIIKHVLERGLDHELDVFLKWSALARWVNWPPTLEKAQRMNCISRTDIDLIAIGQLIDALVAQDEKAWTGAYMIRPAKPPYSPMRKGMFIATIVVGKEFVGVIDRVKLGLSANSVQATCELLQEANFWGPFMAGQVVADWTYTPLLASAADLNTWAPQGPGSRRGFNRLLGRPLKQHISPEEWSEQLQLWRAEIIQELGAEYTTLTAMDVQNALCETDKYLRVRYGEGRPRAVYDTAEGLF